MCCHDTQAADKAANTEVDKHALRFHQSYPGLEQRTCLPLLAVTGSRPKSNAGATDDDDTSIGQEARSYDICLHLLDIGRRRLLGRAEHDDDRADDAVEAADLANEAQALLEKYGR